MKKPTLIIGKKQVILSCLTLMLAVAVYVNYSMSKDDRNLTTAESGVHTYGETEFVNAKAAKATEVATDAAQEETTAVQENAPASFQPDTDRTEDELVTDAIAAVETSKLIESESNIESLIKSQGYADCIVYLDGDSAKVVVKTEGLDSAQAAAIKEAILGEVTLPAENIRIFEVK